MGNQKSAPHWILYFAIAFTLGFWGRGKSEFLMTTIFMVFLFSSKSTPPMKSKGIWDPFFYFCSPNPSVLFVEPKCEFPPHMSPISCWTSFAQWQDVRLNQCQHVRQEIGHISPSLCVVCSEGQHLLPPLFCWHLGLIWSTQMLVLGSFWNLCAILQW